MPTNRNKIRTEWNDLMDSLVVGSVVTSYGLIGRLNGRYWTIRRVGIYLRGDSRVKRIGREGTRSYTEYEVIG